MASRQQVLLLYRQILRAAKHFPSIKKDQVIADIKTEFRDHKVKCVLLCVFGPLRGRGAQKGLNCSHPSVSHCLNRC